MRQSSLLCAVLLGSVVAACTPATAKVFLRVAPSPLPPADKTGIQDLVLTWPLRDSSVVAKFRSQGYRVWLQCESQDLSKVATMADRASAAGVIIGNTGSANQSRASEEIRTYMAAHKNLAFRVLASGGKQPQMKGRLVVERD